MFQPIKDDRKGGDHFFAGELSAQTPGYEGYLNDDVSTMAEVLGAAGYQTAMTGKWHLSAKSPPHERGFEKSFILIEGAGSHFDDAGYSSLNPTVTYLDDGVQTELTEDFYSSDFYVDRMLEYWDGRDTDQPFFGYVSFTAPHWPLHAPRAEIEKYIDRYGESYEALRLERVESLKAADVISQAAEIPESLDFVPPWDSLSPEQQAIEAREMAVYATMIDRMDQAMGRLIARLEADGELDNTIVILSSDNGPEAIDFTTRPILPIATDWVAENYDNSLDSLGSPGSYPFYGVPWAQAGAGPHRYYKTFVTLGGMHVPFIISWPEAIEAGQRFDNVRTMLDVAPTLYDAAGINPATASDVPPDGASILPLLTGEQGSIDSPPVGFELFGHEALVDGEWSLLRLRPPEGGGEWAMYRMSDDPGQLKDLSEAEPEQFQTLLTRYEAWANDVGLVRPGDNYDPLNFGGDHN